MPKRIPRVIVELRGLAHAQSKRPKEPKSLIEYVEVMKVALLHFKMEGWGKFLFFFKHIVALNLQPNSCNYIFLWLHSLLPPNAVAYP